MRTGLVVLGLMLVAGFALANTDAALEASRPFAAARAPEATDFEYTVEWAFQLQTNYCVGLTQVQDTLIWVSSGGRSGTADPNFIYIYDARTHALVDSFQQFVTTAWGYRDMAYDPVTNVVYAGTDSRRLDVIDADAHTLINNYTVSPGPSVIRALGFDGDSLYSADFTNVPIYKFATDGTGGRTVSPIPPFAIYGLAVDLGRNKVYATTADNSHRMIEYTYPGFAVVDTPYIPEITTFGGTELWLDTFLLVLAQATFDSAYCFRLSEPPDHDVGVTQIVAPPPSMLQGSVAPVAKIKNFGTNPETDIPVTCMIDSAGTTVYNQSATYPGPLASGAEANVTFSPNWNTGPAGNTYQVTMYTGLSGDENPGNDTMTGTTNIMTSGPEDTIHVDGPHANNGVGLTAGGTFYTAARLTPTLDGCNVIAVIFYHYQATQNQYTYVWEQNTTGNPGPIVESIPYMGTDTNWVRSDLAVPYHIDVNEDVWVGPRYTHTAGQYPGGVDAGPQVPQRGGFINYQGSWTELRTVGLNYNWNIRAIVQYDGSVEEQILEPARFEVLGVAPSPVRNFANIRFSLARDAQVNLSIFDASGARVRTLIDGVVERGERTASWNRQDDNGRLVANGTYFYRLTVDGKTTAGKAVILD